MSSSLSQSSREPLRQTEATGISPGVWRSTSEEFQAFLYSSVTSVCFSVATACLSVVIYLFHTAAAQFCLFTTVLHLRIKSLRITFQTCIKTWKMFICALLKKHKKATIMKCANVYYYGHSLSYQVNHLLLVSPHTGITNYPELISLFSRNLTTLHRISALFHFANYRKNDLCVLIQCKVSPSTFVVMKCLIKILKTSLAFITEPTAQCRLAADRDSQKLSSTWLQ